MPKKAEILLTCEHGGNQIPARFKKYFDRDVLKTHRGWDIGILKIARELKSLLGAPLISAETSRLLVDLNRSVGKKGLFSEFTPPNQDEILREFYFPYRSEVETAIASRIKRGIQVFHFSMHSFTPVLNGEIRNCEVGLLYDPRRKIEKETCAKLRTALDSKLRTRLNYPYKGIGDGFTATLRRKYGPSSYCGIEIELNQGWITQKKKDDFVSRLAQNIRASINS